MFIGIDPASGPDRAVISDGRGNVIDAPRRGDRLVYVNDLTETEIRAVGPFDDVKIVSWRKAKRMIRNGEAMAVRWKR